MEPRTGYGRQLMMGCFIAALLLAVWSGLPISSKDPLHDISFHDSSSLVVSNDTIWRLSSSGTVLLSGTATLDSVLWRSRPNRDCTLGRELAFTFIFAGIDSSLYASNGLDIHTISYGSGYAVCFSYIEAFHALYRFKMLSIYLPTLAILIF